MFDIAYTIGGSFIFKVHEFLVTKTALGFWIVVLVFKSFVESGKVLVFWKSALAPGFDIARRPRIATVIRVLASVA